MRNRRRTDALTWTAYAAALIGLLATLLVVGANVESDATPTTCPYYARTACH